MKNQGFPEINQLLQLLLGSSAYEKKTVCHVNESSVEDKAAEDVKNGVIVF